MSAATCNVCYYLLSSCSRVIQQEHGTKTRPTYPRSERDLSSAQSQLNHIVSMLVLRSYFPPLIFFTMRTVNRSNIRVEFAFVTGMGSVSYRRVNPRTYIGISIGKILSILRGCCTRGVGPTGFGCSTFSHAFELPAARIQSAYAL